MDFEVLSRVPGSIIHGASALEADLVKQQFSIKFKFQSDVEACANHVFFFTDLTVAGADRIIEPLMLVEDDTVSMTIAGRKIETDNELCELSFKAQV
jgi:hypothetical protein